MPGVREPDGNTRRERTTNPLRFGSRETETGQDASGAPIAATRVKMALA